MNKQVNGDEYFEEFGYNSFGPILFGFTRWLIDELEKENISKVFFLARDGMMIKKAFDILNSNERIKSFYLYASRRAIIVPSLWRLNKKEEIFNSITFNNVIKIRYFLKKVGLEDMDLTDILEKNGLHYNDEINITQLGKNKSFIKFLDEIFLIIKENSKKEYKSMINYFKEMNFKGKVAVVDIGWHGTMQKAISSVMEGIDITGYYLGVIPRGKDETIKQKGYLFDKGNNEELYKKFRNFINIFEFMFLAREGSTKKYDNSTCKYTLYKYEYEKTKEIDIARKIQESAIHYIKNPVKLNLEYPYANLLKVFSKPTLKEAKLFGDIIFQNEDNRHIAKPQSLYKYISSPKKFKCDFIDSSWRIGFLKRLFIIPLPYYWINELIRKIYFWKEYNKNG